MKTVYPQDDEMIVLGDEEGHFPAAYPKLATSQSPLYTSRLNEVSLDEKFISLFHQCRWFT